MARSADDQTDDDLPDDEIERIRQKKREELLERHTGNTTGDHSSGEPQTPDGPETPAEPVEITGSDHLETVVSNYETVLLDCYADWCGPCQMMEPVIEELAATTDAAVAKLDVDTNQQLAAQLGARSIPTLVLFADGEPVQQLVGAQNRGALESLIQRHS